MPQPHGFSWIRKPLLAAMALPESREELNWLRHQGIELLLSLTEEPLPRRWVEDASLLVFHEPMEDMQAPAQEQLERCLSVIDRAHRQEMGVAIHCTAGLGRTGVVLACYFVDQGLSGSNAMARVRELRPGSIETAEQEEAVLEFARRKRKKD